MSIVSCEFEANVINDNADKYQFEDDISSYQKKVDTLVEQTEFEEYFYTLPELQVGYKTECYNIDISDYYSTESNFKPDIANVLGVLTPIKETYFIIYVYAADLSLPILEIYNGKGEKLKDFELFDYGYCTDLLEENQFSSFEIIEENKIEILSYKTLEDSVSIVAKRTIDLLDEVDAIIKP